MVLGMYKRELNVKEQDGDGRAVMSLSERYKGYKGLFNGTADLLILAAFVGSIFFLARPPNPDGVNFCYTTKADSSTGMNYVNWCYDWGSSSKTNYWVAIGTIGAAVIGNLLCLVGRVTEECNSETVDLRKTRLALAYIVYFVPLGVAAGFMADPNFATGYNAKARQTWAMALVLAVTSLHFIGGLWAQRGNSPADQTESTDTIGLLSGAL